MPPSQLSVSRHSRALACDPHDARAPTSSSTAFYRRGADPLSRVPWDMGHGTAYSDTRGDVAHANLAREEMTAKHCPTALSHWDTPLPRHCPFSSSAVSAIDRLKRPISPRFGWLRFAGSRFGRAGIVVNCVAERRWAEGDILIRV